MGYYVLTNGEGSYITLDKGGNKYVPIKSSNAAHKFPDLKRAMNVLNNSITTSIRSHYMPEYHKTEEIVEKIETERQNEICFREIENNEIADWQKRIMQLLDLFGGTDNRTSELSEKLSDVDKKIVDVEHYIEFGKFNAYQGWICFKMLQNLLQQRRQYKNEMQVLQKIKSCPISKEAIKALSDSVAEAQNKVYKPRKFTELFSGWSERRN